MAKKKSSGAGVGGMIAIVCALLALTGNLGTALDVAAEQFPSQDRHEATDHPSTSASGEAKISEEGTVEAAIPSSVTMPTADAAADLLAGLDVADRVKPSNSAYVRDDYGPAWADVDGNGCSQRQDVLHAWLVRSEPSDVRTRGKCSHEVFAGTWHDPYTGRSVTLTDAKSPAQAQKVQIDHIVPLKEAHDSGAVDWPSDRKVEFANDTTNLVPVYGPANASKGGSDAAAWRPRKQHQCDYARRYVSVKAKWNLTVDNSERAALSEMLGTCS